jgi:hypothetical protein
MKVVWLFPGEAIAAYQHVITTYLEVCDSRSQQCRPKGSPGLSKRATSISSVHLYQRCRSGYYAYEADPKALTLIGMSGRHLYPGRRVGNLPGCYFSVAALNLIMSSAGTRPRSLTSMPCALAHSRTSVVFSPFACALRPVWDGRRALPLTRRAALT